MMTATDSKNRDYNATHPVITFRAVSPSQKRLITEAAERAKLPRAQFILEAVLARVGSITPRDTGNTREERMLQDIKFLVRDFFNYIADNGLDSIPPEKIDELGEIQERIRDGY